jgi:hypothetical protein
MYSHSSAVAPAALGDIINLSGEHGPKCWEQVAELRSVLPRASGMILGSFRTNQERRPSCATAQAVDGGGKDEGGRMIRFRE